METETMVTKNVVEVGFEPTPPERLELESSALDHSAIQPGNVQCGFCSSAAPAGDAQRAGVGERVCA